MGDRVRIVKGVAPPPEGPQMPNTYVPPRIDAARSGWNHYFPTTGDELQALAAGTGIARPAVIYLDPAITYTPTTSDIIFEPVADDDQWLYVMPLEANYANISPEGTRVDTARSSEITNMPLIQEDSVNRPVLEVAPQASKIRLVGLRLSHDGTNSVDASQVYLGRVLAGNRLPSNSGEWATEIVMDRCYVYGSDADWTKNYREGVTAVGSRIAIIESRIEWQRGGETKSIWIPWVSERTTVWNNYLDGISAAFFTEGTNDLWVDGQLSDIDFRYNECTKSNNWNASHPDYVGRTGAQMKCHIELKSAQRIYMAFNWCHDQYRNDTNQGWAYQLSCAGGNYASEWHVLEDVICEWNDCRNNPRGCMIAPALNGAESAFSGKIRIRDNLFVCTNFTDDTPTLFAINGVFQPIWNPSFRMEDTRMERNTFVGWLANEPAATAHSCISFGTTSSNGGQCDDFRYIDNVSDGGSYGVFMNGGALSDAAMDNACNPWTVSNSAMYNANSASSLASGMIHEDSIADIGFAQTSDPFGSFAISGQYSSIGCDYNQLVLNTQIAKTGVRF